MYHLTNPQLLLAILALVLAVILATRSILGDRREKHAPFRNYFGAGYQRELLRHSELSESENWRADQESRFTPLNLRNRAVDEQRIRIISSNRYDREED
jgi:hypothetical protein